jgi:hypothetical protein
MGDLPSISTLRACPTWMCRRTMGHSPRQRSSQRWPATKLTGRPVAMQEMR